MSLKWHPDKNHGVDVTSIMQDINEAYKVLNDEISRSRYDKEYYAFSQARNLHSKGQQKTRGESWNYDYDVSDENLKNDINNAREYAKNIVDEFFKNISKTSKIAARGAWEETRGYIVVSIIMTILFVLIKACH